MAAAVPPHLVGEHGQQSLVELNDLQLLLGQFVLNALCVRQLHLLLRVKDVLVLRGETEGLMAETEPGPVGSAGSSPTLLMVMMLLAVTASSPTSDGLKSKRVKFRLL